MRILYPMIIVIFITALLSSSCQGCDQKLYDKIYRDITFDFFKCDTGKKQIELRCLKIRQDLVYSLRYKCNNQLSSYEKGVPDGIPR